MPYTPTKVKCPNCERLIPKEIIQITGGRCPHCGYQIASTMHKFFGMEIKKVHIKV